jgi:nitrite reductase/ring-hydroxylating ferredoxin subunit
MVAKRGKPVCKVSDIPAEGLKQFEVGGKAVCVINSGKQFYACQAHCPHEGIALCDGAYDDGVLTCLEHLWQWNLPAGSAPKTGCRRCSHSTARRARWPTRSFAGTRDAAEGLRIGPGHARQLPGAGRRMLIASNGHTAAHRLQPVQPGGSCSTAVFSQPRASSHSTRGAHTATQRPQPVQRSPISGRGGGGRRLARMFTLAS